MDNNRFINHFSKQIQCDQAEAETFVSQLTAAMRAAICKGDSIAIPGFGQFETIKEKERIVTDPGSGKRLLIPPEIAVKYTPASALLKKLSNTD